MYVGVSCSGERYHAPPSAGTARTGVRAEVSIEIRPGIRRVLGRLLPSPR